MVVIHETGHALGLPDYYDYDDKVGPRGGVGGLDMMDNNWGDHNPFSKWLLGWLELTFVAALPEVPTVDVLAALIVFRGFYLLLPFALAMIVVLIFEYGQWRAKRSAAPEH